MAKNEKDYVPEMNAVKDVMGARLRRWYADGGTPFRSVRGATGPEGVDNVNLNAELLPPRKRKPEGE
jgi:hypothetical protein